MTKMREESDIKEEKKRRGQTQRGKALRITNTSFCGSFFQRSYAAAMSPPWLLLRTESNTYYDRRNIFTHSVTSNQWKEDGPNHRAV